MIRRVKNQALAFGPMQDFKHAWCEFKTMSKMMLEKEWLCNLSKMFS
jgi:hypothetical protein